MKRVCSVILMCLVLAVAKGFHIVGGEIEFIFLQAGRYQINLIQYFDRAQDQNPGPDGTATVYIFRNSDGALMSQHVLLLDTIEQVEYTNIICARPELRTDRIFYTANIDLDPNLYDDPEGYYIQWERCCRNSTVKNIIDPDGTGMNYVLDIPPLMREGRIFQNSSPVLFKPLSDYACINQLYYTEFTGVDRDGDSLVYSLVAPLNSSSQDPLPVPQPKPHVDVSFADGFAENNMIPGRNPLRISSQGLLTVNPSDTGLYVFSVKVEEFRDGEKIGEVRRDFQMLVVDGCEPPDPPVVDVEIPGDPDFDPEKDILSYTVADAACFNFLVSNITPGERISLRAKGVNFDTDINEIFSFRDSLINDGSDLLVEICIPDCPPLTDEPFILDLIAGDDACPLPQLDTVRMTIEVQPPPNEKPITLFDQSTIIQQEDNDPIFTRIIEATDPDNDGLEIRLLVNDIPDPTLFGFDLLVDSTSAGFINGSLVWDTDCTIYDFKETNDFEVLLIVEDADQCLVPGDTVSVQATVILPANTNPIVSTDRALPTEIDLGNILSFEALANDADGDDLALRFAGGNFNPDFFGVQFDSVSGNSSISSDFFWDLSCDADLFQDGQEFELLFIANDNDRCQEQNSDTLKHIIRVNYPENQDPQFQSISEIQRVRVNETVRIPISAFDLDDDLIALQLDPSFRQPASENLTFVPSTGVGSVSSVLQWQPECSLLRFGENTSLQEVFFIVTDNACPIPNTETLKVTFEVFDDANRQDQFRPPNVFTPNNDGKNDSFSLFNSNDINQNLPPDNCDNIFEYIVINNRAGVPVFRSESRDFLWDGNNAEAGVYYYLIKFSNTEFKGILHLLR
ncbi:MAG: gliding motility-associated C-terminal domain-containing protein [Bacteroidota bacterium]